MIKKVPAFKLLLLGSLCIGVDNLLDAHAQANVRTIAYIEHSPSYQNYKSRTIAALLSDARKLFDVDFVYESGILPKKGSNIDPANYKKVDDFLHALLKSSGLKYKMVLSRTYVIYKNEADLKSLVSLLQKDNFQSSNVLKAEISVTGTITDQVTGAGLEGVSVMVKGTSKGTVTGKNGAFSIAVDNESAILVFSLVGYQSREVMVGDKTSLQLALVAQSSAMNEVVVVGYGAQKKSLVTGAISSVKAEELSSSSSSRVEQALQGRTAGVTVLPSSGSPGSGMNVRIRGAGSNGSSQPLYIIDGVRAGGIEYLDPSEIASVEVLKDAASAAIYGAEGANGVVIITTKTGKRNTSEITYSTQYGQQSVKKDLMPMMNAQQYQEYLEAANAPIRPTAADVAGIKGTNWFNEVFQKAPLMRHSLAFSGGTEKSTYSIDGTYFNQEGIVGGGISQNLPDIHYGSIQIIK